MSAKQRQPCERLVTRRRQDRHSSPFGINKRVKTWATYREITCRCHHKGPSLLPKAGWSRDLRRLPCLLTADKGTSLGSSCSIPRGCSPWGHQVPSSSSPEGTFLTFFSRTGAGLCLLRGVRCEACLSPTSASLGRCGLWISTSYLLLQWLVLNTPSSSAPTTHTTSPSSFTHPTLPSTSQCGPHCRLGRRSWFSMEQSCLEQGSALQVDRHRPRCSILEQA